MNDRRREVRLTRLLNARPYAPLIAVLCFTADAVARHNNATMLQCGDSALTLAT